MIKYIGKIVLGEDMYHIKDIEARASIDDKPGSDDFENLGDALTILTVDDAIAKANKEDSVISFSEDTASVDKGSTITKTVTVTAGDGAVTYSSSDTDVATVDSSGVVTGISAGTCTITASIASTSIYKAATASYTLTVIYDPYGGHDYVDLGLPSGTKWAIMNVGATKPEEQGYFFSWGNVEGHCLNGKTDYSFGTGNSVEPYVSSSGATLSGDIPVGDAYDMARANMGASWRLPTTTEFQELYDNCTSAWVTQDGMNGRRFTSNINGNSIFFPAGGFYYERSSNYVGSNGRYWSSSFHSADRAYYLYFKSSDVTPQPNSNRFYGLSVRGVVG